jgi:hypothetical protein
VRYSQTTLYTCSRAARGSNQRLQFDLDGPGRHLATGGTDGCVRVRGLAGFWGEGARQQDSEPCAMPDLVFA